LALEELEARTLLSFLPAVNYNLGTHPQVVAVGEFRTGSGIKDIAVAEHLTNKVAVLLGNGDGTFHNPVNYDAGSFPQIVAAGDLNHDGNLDLAVTNGSNDTVAVLLGNGDGTFQKPVNYDVGSYPTYVVIDDFNGDGNPDLVVANGNSNSLSVLLGNGDGTFMPAVNYPTGSAPWVLATGEFRTGSGIKDIAVTNKNSNTVSVLLGNGDGTFQPRQDFSVGLTPVGIVAGDFYGDGNLDLVVTNSGSNTLSVLRGNGDGTFQRPQSYSTSLATPWQVAAAEFDGDGKLDLVMGYGRNENTTVSVLLGNGNGTFQPALNYPVGLNAALVATSDLNGDGFPDLVVSNVEGDSLSVLINDMNWSGGGGGSGGSGGGTRFPNLPAVLSWPTYEGNTGWLGDVGQGNLAQAVDVAEVCSVVQFPNDLGSNALQNSQQVDKHLLREGGSDLFFGSLGQDRLPDRQGLDFLFVRFREQTILGGPDWEPRGDVTL
jgi:hypothetical protein